eukprot:scaffold5981_cov141-Isochrysis_galbana.AAC.5
MRLTIAWGAPSAGVAKRMRMAWCLRAAGVRGNTKGSSNALSELMRINSPRTFGHEGWIGRRSMSFVHACSFPSGGSAGNSPSARRKLGARGGLFSYSRAGVCRCALPHKSLSGVLRECARALRCPIPRPGPGLSGVPPTVRGGGRPRGGRGSGWRLSVPSPCPDGLYRGEKGASPSSPRALLLLEAAPQAQHRRPSRTSRRPPHSLHRLSPSAPRRPPSTGSPGPGFLRQTLGRRLDIYY